jgi:endonuclease/exonuclease/phosphatase family metal-dependent hydrolase
VSNSDAGTSDASTGDGIDPPRLRVMSYNVHGLRGRKALTAVVRAVAPDVVVAQEVPSRFGWRRRCASLAHDCGLLYAGGGLPSMGNVIIVAQRVRVRAVRCIRYPLTPGRHMRGAVAVDASVGGVDFTVAGSHLSIDPVERPVQAQRYRDFAASAGAPLILAGDLNDIDGTQTWRVALAGLVDAGAGSAAPTFSVESPRRRIDVIFTNPDVTVDSYQVVNSPDVRRASDHFPVVANLTFH